MAKKGFTGSEIYFQDKFNEFDLETRYNQLAPKEGFEQVWRDIKNSDFIESMKMEEGEWGKFPPLPISLAGLASLIPAMRLLKPIKGLYELEKKTGGLGVSMFKTIAGDKSRREFLNTLILNSKKMKDIKLKQLYKETAEKVRRNPGFKFPGKKEMDKFFQGLRKKYLKQKTNGKTKLKDWDTTGKTLHATGGRIGFDEGGSTQKEIDKALVAIEKLKPGLMPESYEALIEIYKDKQKELDIGIMESAGGLGEMLGEGGRAGFQGGGTSIRKYEIPPKALPLIQEMYEKAGGRGQTGLTLKEFAFQYFGKKKGGRIGMAEGMSPSERWMRDYFYDGKGGYDNQMSFKQFQMGPGVDLWNKHSGKAKGGRIGFQEGTGIMSQTGIPYYADKAVEGIVNSAETLSKLPFAAGELGSKLLRQKPTKKMFSEALENITPGSWSKNLGLQSLIEKEGAKVSDKQRTIGNVLRLGTESAAPVGGAFKIGQKLISQASKVMGKLKKGKTLEQAIDDKITSFGQSRRDFNIVAGTSGLMVALKAIGLGGIVTKADDFAVKLKTKFFNDDVDYGATGQAFFDLSSLTGPVKLAASSLIKKLKIKDLKNVDPGDAKLVIKNLKDKGFNGKLTGIVDEGGDVIKQAEKAGHTTFLKTYKKQSMKQNVKDHKQYNDFVIYENDPGWINWKPKAPNFTPFKSTIDEVVEILEPVVKKAAGGPVGFPPEVYGPPAPKKIPSPIPLPPTDGPSPRPNIQKFRDSYWEFDIRLPAKEKPGETVDPREGIGLDAFGDIDVDMSDPRFQFGRYDPKKGYHPWEFEVGKDSAGVKWKKRFDQGGIARRPNAVPPLSGPTPQGLTFLLGDDIVKSRIK